MPLHKLFPGRECVAGLDLDLQLSSGLRNDELGSFHRFLDVQGLRNNWSEPHLGEFPFSIRDDLIGALSRRQEFGSGVLEPRPGPLFSAAQYQGRPLTFPVDGSFTSDPQNLEFSSLQVLQSAPSGPGTARGTWTTRRSRRSARLPSTSTSATGCCRTGRSITSTCTRT